MPNHIEFKVGGLTKCWPNLDSVQRILSMWNMLLIAIGTWGVPQKTCPPEIKSESNNYISVNTACAGHLTVTEDSTLTSDRWSFMVGGSWPLHLPLGSVPSMIILTACILQWLATWT